MAEDRREQLNQLLKQLFAVPKIREQLYSFGDSILYLAHRQTELACELLLQRQPDKDVYDPAFYISLLKQYKFSLRVRWVVLHPPPTRGAYIEELEHIYRSRYNHPSTRLRDERRRNLHIYFVTALSLERQASLDEHERRQRRRRVRARNHNNNDNHNNNNNNA